MPISQMRAWIMLVVPALAYVTYVVVMVISTYGRPITETPYVIPMLVSIGVGALGSVVGEIVFAVTTAKDGAEARRIDERDREIDRFGNHVGNAFVVIGAIAALIMAMLEWPYFWLANVIYLAFVLSAVLGSAARLAAYRESFQPW